MRTLLHILLASIASLAPAQPTSTPTYTPPPLPALHAHNDYEHPRPLLDAMDAGARSIEADIHLVNGELLVAHDLDKATPGRTLTALYLDPLKSRIAAHNGSVYGDLATTYLLIDIKGKAEEIYPALKTVLAPYASLLTSPSHVGPITVILTGNQPDRAALAADPDRLVFLDGALADLDKSPDGPADLTPLVSANFKVTFKWKGKGSLPAEDDALMTRLVAQAHAAHRTLRFWGAPDTPAAWKVLLQHHVDWINTDHLAAASDFLRSWPASQPATEKPPSGATDK